MGAPETLTAAQRGEVRVGRVGNVVGWSIGALIVAVAMEFVAMILVDDVLDAAIDPLTGGSTVPDGIAVVLSGLLVGGALGGVIGSRVRARPVLVSLLVTLLYLALWPFALMVSAPGGLWIAIGAVAHLASAGAAARFMSSRATR